MFGNGREYIFGFCGIENSHGGERREGEGLNDCGAIEFAYRLLFKCPRFTLLILNEGNAQVSQQGDDVSV